MSRRQSSGRGNTRANRAAVQKAKKNVSNSRKNGFKEEGSIFALLSENEYEVDSSDGDGNCLFRSISTSLTGSESHHLRVRLVVCAELSRAVPKAIANQAEIEEQERQASKNGKSQSQSNSNLYQNEDEIMGGKRSRRAAREDKIKPRHSKDNPSSLILSSLAIPDYHFFVLGDFDDYCKRMGSNSIWGGHLEIQAAANVFGIKIVVLQDRFPPILVNPDTSLWPDPPTLAMYLIYRGGCHYDAVLPTSERREDFKHSHSQLNELSDLIKDRYTKLVTEIPIELELVEPVNQSWLLSPEGLARSREAGDEAKRKNAAKKSYSKWNFGDSQDDNDDEEDEDGANDDAKRLARPTNPDSSGDVCDDGDGVGVGHNDVMDVTVPPKKTKSSSTSTIPTLSFVFGANGTGSSAETSKIKTKSKSKTSNSKSKGKSSLSDAMHAMSLSLDEADGFSTFMDDGDDDHMDGKQTLDTMGDGESDGDGVAQGEIDQLISQVSSMVLDSSDKQSTSNSKGEVGITGQVSDAQKNEEENAIPALLFTFPVPKRSKTSSKSSKSKTPTRSSARLREKGSTKK